MEEPKPISELDPEGIRGVFFDIDDTFTTQGKISRGAFHALWDLKDAGKIAIPLTGRPAGWCDHIARMWPVDAVVGENGAFYFMMKQGAMERKYMQNPRDRKTSKEKLEAIRREVLAAFPKAAVARDQAYREFDLAIDFREDIEPVAEEEIAGIVQIFEKHGAKVKVSSIHVNGWFGNYDKLTMTRCFAEEELGIDLEKKKSAFCFIGDSPNDAPLFQFFEKSVGVANVLDFKDSLEAGPAFITKEKWGKGFAEAVKRILSS
jgi:HAD superfamily hydrolase (TIGR01484 family)